MIGILKGNVGNKDRDFFTIPNKLYNKLNIDCGIPSKKNVTEYQIKLITVNMYNIKLIPYTRYNSKFIYCKNSNYKRRLI